jgi:Leucyl aminopeptidase
MALQFTLNTVTPSTINADCVVVGLFANGSLSASGSALDTASNGALTRLISRGDLSGKAGSTTLLHDLPGITAPRVLVVGLGDAAKLNAAGYIKAIGAAIKALKTGAAKRVALTLAELSVPGRDRPGPSARR